MNQLSFYSLIASLTVLISCNQVAEEKEYIYQLPKKTADNWKVSSLSAQGVDSVPIVEMIKSIRGEQYTGISSVVIARHGFLVLDEYFGEGSRDTIHTMRSASKSITSALVGIAIDQKYIVSVDAPLFSYFPEYEGNIKNWDDRKAEITLAHILSMTSGIQGDEDAMYPTEDWVKFYLDQPLQNVPGEKFSYCTSGVVTLGSVLSKASGLRVPDFANRYLFGPLGITDYFWPITNSMGNKGFAMTGGGLKLRSRDMAKFGQLYLNAGSWQGKQIISGSWIQLSMKKHATSDLYGEDFGYLWRIIDRSLDGREIRSYEAWGNGGQFILIFPSLELVVVFTGENYGKFPEMEQPFELVEKYILRAIK